MSGGMEAAAREEEIRLTKEKEERAVFVHYEQKIFREKIGSAFIELLNLVKKYKEIK